MPWHYRFFSKLAVRLKGEMDQYRRTIEVSQRSDASPQPPVLETERELPV